MDLGDLPDLPAGRRAGLEGLVARRDASRHVRRCTAMPNRRTVFFVSDRTGITAEMLGNSLLSQFDEIEFQRLTIPFVDSAEKIAAVIEQINETTGARGTPADRVQLDRRRRHERHAAAAYERADARPVPGLRRAARVRARRQELARGRPLARDRQQPRVFRADGRDQFRADARRRRRDPRPRAGRRSSWSESRAAARRPRRSISRCNSASARPIFR